MKYLEKLILIEYSDVLDTIANYKIKVMRNSNTYASKTDEKEKIKAINLIMQCYKMRFEMINSEPELINQKRYMKDLSINM